LDVGSRARANPGERLDEQRFRPCALQHRRHIGVAWPLVEALGGVQDARKHVDVPDCVEEDSRLPEHPPDGEVDVGLILERLAPGAPGVLAAYSGSHGDRLAACLALGVKSYEGYDPNVELRSGLSKLIEAHRESTEVTLHFTKFPRCIGKSYHVVFTSPPFHSLEKYPGSLEDSSLSFRAWVDHIYKPYVISAALSVAPGGILALYITDLPNRPLGKIAMDLIEPTLEFVETVTYSGSYIDVIGRKTISYDKECHVWKPYNIPPGF